MPRTYWMEPGQTIFVSGLMRIDLLEVSSKINVFLLLCPYVFKNRNHFDIDYK